MPPGENVLINFTARYDEVVRATNAIISQFRLISVELAKLGHGDAGAFDIGADQLEEDTKNAVTAIEALIKKLAILDEAMARAEKKGAKRLRFGQLPEGAADMLGVKLGQKVEVTRIDEERLAISQQLQSIYAGMNAQRERSERVILDLARQQPEIFQKVLQLATERQFIEQRVARILQGDTAGEILTSRLQQLQSAQATIQQNLAALEQSALAQLGTRAGGRINEQRLRQEDNLKKAVAERGRIEAQIATLTKTLGSGALADQKSRVAVEKQLEAAVRSRGDAIKREFQAQELLKRPNAELESALQLGGVGGLVARMRKDLAALQKQQLDLATGGIEGLSPGFVALQNQLASVRVRLNLVIQGTQQHNELLAEQARLVAQIEAEAPKIAGQGIKRGLDPETFRAQQLAKLPGLERAFIGAFDDMFRRFQATLQFAISGALIFGIQQGLRKFLETAIEVERAFADIGTAFEFDVDFDRGSTEFNRQLNGIRLQILSVADEFNVLPTEANKAAFSMVARFGDTADAMTALRAQLLATKISTIDQSEALRALSAVAENFAAAALFVDNGLSTQEKLFNRERAAVQNYGKALDVAALIQQRFGVEVEDTLEGMARLAPTFSQLGFSMEQTASIVAAVSRELGQTGAQAAERLGRSIGQITEPGIRDDLLALAASSDALTLTFEDFSSGERALGALVAQFRNLEQVDPATAFQLLNVLGQRRELEVVAALFNTTELQDSMVDALDGAAGAAEDRFGFLAQTILERLSSIGGGFERLAQNFTELGLLGPLKVAVAALDEILKKVNQFLELLNTLVTELGVVGKAAKIAFSFVIASAAITRAAGLIANIATFGGKAAAGAAEAATAAGVGVVAVSATRLSATLDKVKQAAVGNRVGLIFLTRALLSAGAAAIKFAADLIVGGVANSFGRGLFTLGARFPRLAAALQLWNNRLVDSGKSLLGMVGAATAVVGILALLYIGIKNIISGLDVGHEAIADFARATTQAEADVRKRRVNNPGDFPTELDFQVALQDQILTNIKASAEENVMSGLEEFFVTVGGMPAAALDHALAAQATERIKEKVRESFFGFYKEVFQDSWLQILAGMGPNFKSVIAGTEGFNEDTVFPAQKAALAVRIQKLLQDVIATAATDVEFGPALTRDLGQFNLTRQVEVLAETVSGAKNTEQLDNAETAIGTLEAKWQEFLQNQGRSVGSIEGSVKRSQDIIDQAIRGFNLGRLSSADMEQIIAEQIRNMRVLGASLVVMPGQTPFLPNQQELADSTLKSAEDAQLAALQRRLESFERQRNAAGLIRDETVRLAEQIKITAREVEFRIKTGNPNEIAEAEIRLAQLRLDYADKLREQALTLAEGRVALAQSSAEWFSAQNALIDELRRQLIGLIELDRVLDMFGTGLNPAIIQAAKQAVQGATNERSDRALDEAQRTAIATARLSGAINDKMADLTGQINAVNLALADPGTDTLEAWELQVKLRELLAQRLQEEVARLSAFVAVQAGVNNEILSLQGQIVVAIEEVKASEQIFSNLSSEFNQARARLAGLKNQLGNALLSLDDINRRLGSDLSDDFAQTILDLQLLAEKLQAPDLGDLETAQLLLEKARGEMQAERGFFSRELFNLRFLSETGAIGTSAYLGALRSLLAQVDTTTEQGKGIFLEIQGLIDGLTEDVSDMAFNVPTEIRLPTIFEIRRALTADQMGVNYMDNRQMEINVNVRDAAEVQNLVDILANSLAGNITSTSGRFAPGAASLTMGGF